MRVTKRMGRSLVEVEWSCVSCIVFPRRHSRVEVLIVPYRIFSAYDR
jgi:hypothetical protein